MAAYWQNLIIIVGISAILAASLNFVLGYAGIFNAAHSVFYGVGAYTASLVALHYTNSFFVTALVAMLVTGLVALLLTVPALRVKEEYFVVASMGFQIMASSVFSDWNSVTGGSGGLNGIPPARLFDWEMNGYGAYLILTLSCLALVLATLALLIRSPLGRQLKALRDDEVAAETLGKRPVTLRVIAMVISGMLAAIAGTIYSGFVSFVNPESFTSEYSVLLMSMVIIGGVGTMAGPVLGAIFLTAFPPLLSLLHIIPNKYVGPVQQIVYGTAMVFLMIYQPNGLVGLWDRVKVRIGNGRLKGRKAPVTVGGEAQ